MDVIGVGALNWDLFYDVPSLTVAGHTFEAGGNVAVEQELFSRVSQALPPGRARARSGGGSAANTVVALSRMGYSTGFLGITGKDENGKLLLSSMEGVDIGHVRRYQRAGVCISLLSKGERSLLSIPNSNDMFAFTAEDVEYLNTAKFVHLSSFSSTSALLQQKQLLELLDDGVYVSFAPGEKYARRGMKEVGDIIARSRIVFLNQREMGLLTGAGPAEGSRALLDLGAKVIVCTMGDEGSMINTSTSEVRVPARRAVVVDTTGAGDVYAAGFLAGYLDGASLEVCGRIGASASALSLSSYGREGYPDERFLRKFAKELD